MANDIVDGWARLDDDQKLVRATKIAVAGIKKVLDAVDPEERDRLYAEFRAMSDEERADLIQRTLQREGIELSSMADVDVDV